MVTRTVNTPRDISQPPPNVGPYNFQQVRYVVWNWRQVYPYNRRLAVEYLSPRCALWISLLALLVHALWAAHSHCGVNFQRAGAIISLAAAVLYATVEAHRNDAAKLSGSPILPFSFYAPGFLLPFLAALGTAIWGYGDLIPYFGTRCAG